MIEQSSSAAAYLPIAEQDSRLISSTMQIWERRAALLGTPDYFHVRQESANGWRRGSLQ